MRPYVFSRRSSSSPVCPDPVVSERELLDVHVVAELLGVLGIDLPVMGHLLHVLELAGQCLGLDVLHRIVDVAQGAEMGGED